MEETNKTIIKYSSYTPAQKRATQKYRENNKDKVNEQRKKYYQNRKERDPDFLEYKRTKAKEYYQLKKQLKTVPEVPEPEPEPEPELPPPPPTPEPKEEDPPNHCSPPDLIIRQPKVKMTIKKTIKTV